MIIFDLDGTLADCEHRRHFVENPHAIAGQSPDCNCSENDREFSCPFDDWSSWKPNWPAFNEACDKDTLIHPVFKIMVTLDHPYEIWSGRCESVREKTIEWLNQYMAISEMPNIKMRPIGDFTPDEELKERWLDKAIAEGKTIDFVFDDRPKVIQMWRRRGIFVFDCNQMCLAI